MSQCTEVAQCQIKLEFVHVSNTDIPNTKFAFLFPLIYVSQGMVNGSYPNYVAVKISIIILMLTLVNISLTKDMQNQMRMFYALAMELEFAHFDEVQTNLQHIRLKIEKGVLKL